MKTKTVKALKVLLKTISQEELNKNKELEKKVIFLEKYLSQTVFQEGKEKLLNKA